MAKILVVDDDIRICLFFSQIIEQMGHAFSLAHNLKDALAASGSGCFDLVLLDLELPDGNGIQILPQIIKTSSEPEVIIITGTGDARGAEIAFKYGAWDYVQKPFLLDEVSLPITRALQYRMEKKSLNPPLNLKRTRIMGESEALRKCLEEVAKAAITDAGVLITGETGTGKELIARAIHENSRRASRPFIVVDCGALPETLVESTLFGHEKGAFTGAEKQQEGLIAQADGGTLMLDEVGELSLTVQKAFLRALQEKRVRPIGGKKEKQVDFRIVAATNQDLDQMAREKQFREDLLYRIRAMEINLPPLRERGKDIEEITMKKLHELANRYGLETKAISPEFFKTLMAWQWPGNIRELNNVLEYALASAGRDPTLFPKHLPAEYRIARIEFEPGVKPRERDSVTDIPDGNADLPSLSDYRNRLEKKYLKLLLEKAKGNREVALQISGISQSRLYSLLAKHGLPGFGMI